MAIHIPRNIFKHSNLGTATGILDILMKHGGNREGAKSKFSIARLSSQLNALDGLYRSNLYEVTISVAQSWWAPLNLQNNEQLTFLCNSATLPGVQILASDHRRQSFGPFDRRVFGVQITDIPLTFMLDNKGFILSFFQNWMNNIVYYSPEDEHSMQVHTKAQKFEVNYRDNYECKIQIRTFDHTAQEIITYTLFEAFPFQLGDVSVAWAETDAFSLLPVQFTFRNYTTNRQPAGQAISERASAEPDTSKSGAKGGYPAGPTTGIENRPLTVATNRANRLGG